MFRNKIIFIFLAFHFSGISGQFLNCNYVNTLDCIHYTGGGVVCASNGQDYSNRCYYAKAHCLDHQLRIFGEGTCASVGFTVAKPTTRAPSTSTKRTSAARFTRVPSTPTTQATTTNQPTSDPLHVICDTISHVHCANDIEPVCGSDGRTYVNMCEFHVEVCQHHDLTIKHIGFC